MQSRPEVCFTDGDRHEIPPARLLRDRGRPHRDLAAIADRDCRLRLNAVRFAVARFIDALSAMRSASCRQKRDDCAGQLDEWTRP